MKKIFLATLLLAFGSGIAVNAAPAAIAMEIAAAEETPVKPEELPEAVKTALKGDAYAGWQASAAFLVKEGENEYYKIELTKGEEKQVVKLSKDGQAIK